MRPSLLDHTSHLLINFFHNQNGQQPTRMIWRVNIEMTFVQDTRGSYSLLISPNQSALWTHSRDSSYFLSCLQNMFLLLVAHAPLVKCRLTLYKSSFLRLHYVKLSSSRTSDVTNSPLRFCVVQCNNWPSVKSEEADMVGLGQVKPRRNIERIKHACVPHDCPSCG